MDSSAFFLVAVAVFIGNIMALSFLWAMQRLKHIYDGDDIPWLVYPAFLVPIGIATVPFIVLKSSIQ